MNNGNFIPCRTLGDLESCLTADHHCVPTVEFNVFNFNAPLDNDALAFFNASKINVFAANQGQVAQANANPLVSSSAGLSDPGMTFNNPFILLGLCVYAYGDPYALTISGNHFQTQADFAAAGHLPASPMNLRTPLVPTLFDAAGATPPTDVSPSQIEHGGPIWRALWAFMHAYRLEMKCPGSDYEILMNESLADLGNCCSMTDWDGFGTSQASHIRVVRALNDRLATITLPAASGFADNGFFVPWNSEQFADGAITPEVYTPDPAAYGRPISMPAVEQWYKLPCPIPFPSVPQPKLKITLTRENGDLQYHTRMLEELTAIYDQNPVPGAGITTHFRLNDAPIIGDQFGFGGLTRWPSGQFRVGIGLKGFEVHPTVCEQLTEALSGRPMDQLMCDPKLAGIVGRGGIVRGPWNGPGQACGPVGR